MKTKILIINKIHQIFFAYIFFFKFDKIYVLDSDNRLSRLINKVTLPKVIFAPNGISYKNFDNLEIISRESIDFKNIDFKSLTFYKFLRNFLDEKGSKSFLIKGFYHYENFHKYKIAINYLNRQYKFPIFHTFFYNDINKIFNFKSLLNNNMTLRFLNYFFINFYLYKLNKIHNRNLPKKNNGKYYFATEISNPYFFNQELGQSNFLSNYHKTIFYRTSAKNVNQDQANLKFEKFQKRSDFLDLRFIKIDRIFFKNLKIHLKEIDFLYSYNLNLLNKFIISYNEIFNLILLSNIKKVLFLESNNELRFINLESGIITSLCNSFGIKTVSYQTRGAYFIDPLSFFSYVNKFYYWSKFWNPANYLNDFIDEKVYFSPFKKKLDFSNSNKIISFFPSEINNSIHCSINYFENFLKLIFSLCLKFPDYNFKLKPKYSNQIQKNKYDFKKYSNLEILDPNYDSFYIIDNSNLVVSMGYTSTTFIALAKGVKGIFYSKLNIKNKSLSNLPIVYNNKKKLIKDFETIIQNKNNKIFNKSFDELFIKNQVKIF